VCDRFTERHGRSCRTSNTSPVDNGIPAPMRGGLGLLACRAATSTCSDEHTILGQSLRLHTHRSSTGLHRTPPVSSLPAHGRAVAPVPRTPPTPTDGARRTFPLGSQHSRIAVPAPPPVVHLAPLAPFHQTVTTLNSASPVTERSARRFNGSRISVPIPTPVVKPAPPTSNGGSLSTLDRASASIGVGHGLDDTGSPQERRTVTLRLRNGTVAGSRAGGHSVSRRRASSTAWRILRGAQRRLCGFGRRARRMSARRRIRVGVFLTLTARPGRATPPTSCLPAGYGRVVFRQLPRLIDGVRTVI
jgi:hypothetical protein